MLPTDQTTLSGAQRPTITDARSCRTWLQALPLTNAVHAQGEMQLQLELLNHSTALAGVERLRILEELRESVMYLQGEVARKYLGKPVPLEASEESTWKKALALWQSFSHGYQICLQNYRDNDQALASFVPLIMHRILRLLTQEMLEYFRVYRDAPDPLWKQLHRAYATAEELKLTKAGVKDPLNRMIESSRPEAAYTQALLLDLANPYHLTGRQLTQVDRWLDKWAARVELATSPVTPVAPELSNLPPLVIDLGRATGVQIGTRFESGPQIRHVNIQLLVATLIKRIRHLRKGAPIAELDLGDDCVQPACEQLLSDLYAQWCEPFRHRAYERRPSEAKVQVCFGVAAIHFFCNGAKPFRQPGEREREHMSWQEAQDIKLFGQLSTSTQRLQSSQLGYATESWRVEDESALGFRLAADGLRAARLGVGQLIAIRHPQSANFAIGHIRWLRFEDKGDLNIGVHTFPGIPMPVGIRAPVLIPTLQNKFQQAFLLPEIPALSQPATLVLPPGWYAPDKQIELHIDETLTVRLTALLDRGADFDRVGFSIR